MWQALRLTGQDSILITRADALRCRPTHFNASVIGCNNRIAGRRKFDTTLRIPGEPLR